MAQHKSTQKIGSPKIQVQHTLWSWAGTVRREWLSRVLTNSGGWDLVGIGTLWRVDHHRARPGGYLFDQLGSIEFSEGIFRFWDRPRISNTDKLLDCNCLGSFKQPRRESIVNADLIWLVLSISECYIGSSCLSVDQWQSVYTQLGLWQRQTPTVDFPPNSQGWPLQTGQILVPLPLHITFSSPFHLLSSCVRVLPRPKWSADQMISQGVQTY